MALSNHEKWFTISKTKLVGKKWKIWTILCFYFAAKNGLPALSMANSLVVRRVSPGRIIVVLFWTKYAVPLQIKSGIHKLTTSRGQRNLCTVFIFVSREEKGFYRIVSFRWNTKILTADRTAGSAAVCKVKNTKKKKLVASSKTQVSNYHLSITSNSLQRELSSVEEMFYCIWKVKWWSEI